MNRQNCNEEVSVKIFLDILFLYSHFENFFDIIVAKQINLFLFNYFESRNFIKIPITEIDCLDIFSY